MIPENSTARNIVVVFVRFYNSIFVRSFSLQNRLRQVFFVSKSFSLDLTISISLGLYFICLQFLCQIKNRGEMYRNNRKSKKVTNKKQNQRLVYFKFTQAKFKR